tara:strand:- start:297 stop:422 length:126 start_codon:yes stop_codon:yes gene_type:complete
MTIYWLSNLNIHNKKRGFKKPIAQARQYMLGYNDAKKFKIK